MGVSVLEVEMKVSKVRESVTKTCIEGKKGGREYTSLVSFYFSVFKMEGEHLAESWKVVTEGMTYKIHESD